MSNNDKLSPRSIVTGLIAFLSLIGTILLLDQLHRWGEIEGVQSGTIISVHDFPGRTLTRVATVKLSRNGEIVKIACNSCRRGEYIQISKRQSLLTGEAVYERFSK